MKAFYAKWKQHMRQVSRKSTMYLYVADKLLFLSYISVEVIVELVMFSWLKLQGCFHYDDVYEIIHFN